MTTGGSPRVTHSGMQLSFSVYGGGTRVFSMPTPVMFSTLIYQYCSIFKTHPVTCFKRPLIIYNSRHVVNMCKNLLHCTVWETLAKQKTGPVESRCIDCPVSEPELVGSLEGKLVATKGQLTFSISLKAFNSDFSVR